MHIPFCISNQSLILIYSRFLIQLWCPMRLQYMSWFVYYYVGRVFVYYRLGPNPLSHKIILYALLFGSWMMHSICFTLTLIRNIIFSILCLWLVRYYVWPLVIILFRFVQVLCCMKSFVCVTLWLQDDAFYLLYSDP
jgi:hypothetical protein